MKLRILSDLHLNGHRDGGYEFIRTLPLIDEDVLVLAGDIVNAKALTSALELFVERVQKPIIYVRGNHEHWGEQLNEPLPINVPGVHVLENSSVVIAGQRFIGGTLWFQETPYVIRTLCKETKDRAKIGSFQILHGAYAEQAAQYLIDKVRSTDVVVTHYLPSLACVHPVYKEKDILVNDYYVNQRAEYALYNKPKLWIHGHCHTHVDFVHDSGTRVVANPMGWSWETSTSGFDPLFMVEIP